MLGSRAMLQSEGAGHNDLQCADVKGAFKLGGCLALHHCSHGSSSKVFAPINLPGGVILFFRSPSPSRSADVGPQ